MADTPQTTAPHIVFAASFDPHQSIEISLTLSGEWDDDLIDAATEFLTRQRKRLRNRDRRGPLLCDGWEDACNGAA